MGSGREHPVGSGREHPVGSADPMTVAARRPEPARRGPYPAARPRRTCRRGRRRRTRSGRRSGRWGRNEWGRKDSGHRRAARKGSPGCPPADRCPCCRRYHRFRPAARAPAADTSVRQPRSPPAESPAAGRVPSVRRSLRPARRPRTVAGPDRRWPRWSPNRLSGSRTCCPAEDLAREPVTARIGTCDPGARLPTVSTPDVIPYQGWTHGWTCSELDLSTQNRASSTIRDARPDAGRPEPAVLPVTACMPGWHCRAVS